MPPKFFVTHSWKDIEFAHRLCDDLRANGLEGFFDAHSMSPGDSIPSRIERGLKECDVYIPVFSPDALKSDWCDWEIDIAITMNRTQKGQPRIIPVIAQPCTVPTRLMHLLYINFVGRYDGALDELLTKGFDLPATRPVSPTPLEHPAVSPPVPRKNWLLLSGAVVAVAIIMLIVARAMFVAPPATSTPPSVAGVTSAPAAVSLNSKLGIGSTKTAKDGSLMMFVPAGEFLMGTSDADPNPLPEEKPQHPVYLNAFWIAKDEVTNAQYKKCVDAGRCTAPGDTAARPNVWPNGTTPPGKDNHPVFGVSWNDALAYAQWIGGRLPTEAEWEKAACWDETNKVKRVYPWGNVSAFWTSNTGEFGNHDTTPVGKYSPQGDSPYGVSDMAGNVWEWTSTIWGKELIVPDFKYPYRAEDGRENLTVQSHRVLRGGSWDSQVDNARCAYRDPRDAYFLYQSVGFRVAESVP